MRLQVNTALFILCISFCTSVSAQPFNGFAALDGDSDYFYINDLLPNADFTVEALVRACENDLDISKVIFTNDTTFYLNYIKFYEPDYDDPIAFSIETCYESSLSAGCGSGDLGSASSSVTGDNWYHLVWQFDKSEKSFEMFIDGYGGLFLIFSGTFLIGDEFYIGKFLSLTFTTAFKGYVDEVRVSSGLRYPSIFSPAVEPFETDENTLALWHFDDTEYPLLTIEDASGNGKHLSVFGDAHISFPYEPVIEGPAEVFNMEEYIYSAAGMPGGLTATWLTDGATITAGDAVGEVIIEWDMPGTYILQLTTGDAGLGCEDSIMEITVIVNPNPVCAMDASGPLTFCEGDSVMLSVTAGAESYLWNTGETTPSITAIETGTYEVTMFYTTGDSSLCQSEIIGYPSPTATIEANGSTAICAGDSVVLSATEGYIYLWNTADTTQSITAIESDIYAVLMTDDNGCTTLAEAEVIVYPLPIAFVNAGGEFALCAGDSLILGTTNDMMNYIWNTGESEQFISVTLAGIYSVTITDSNGCTASAEAEVFAYPAPIASIEASGDISFCAGDSVMLGAPHDMVSYIWNTGETMQLITVMVTGIYTVIITDDNGCSSSADTSVTVYDLPFCFIDPDGPTTFYTGDSVILSAPAGYIYAWNTGETEQSIIVKTSGVYSLTLIDEKNCSSACEIEITVDLIPQNMEDLYLYVKIYPTISDGLFWIQNNSQTNLTMDVFSIQSELTLHKLVQRGKNILDLSSFPSGNYLLRLTNGKNVYVSRVVLD